MIQGSVSADGVPTVLLPVAGRDWPAIIDSGFNGDLELPEALRSFTNPRYIGPLHSSLAGGQSIDEDSYFVDFPFDGSTLLAVATFVEDVGILIGTHLLRRHKLEIDFPAATVHLERPL